MANAFFSPQVRAAVAAANARTNGANAMTLAPVQTFQQALMASGQQSGRMLAAGLAGLASPGNAQEAVAQVMDPVGYAQRKQLEQEQGRQRDIAKIAANIQRTMSKEPAYKRTEALLQQAGDKLNANEKMRLIQQADKQRVAWRDEERQNRQEARAIKNREQDVAWERRKHTAAERRHREAQDLKREEMQREIKREALQDEAKVIDRLQNLSNRQSGPIEQYRTVATYYKVAQNAAANYSPANQINLIQAFTKSMGPDSVTTSGEIRASEEALHELVRLGVTIPGVGRVTMTDLKQALNNGKPLILSVDQRRGVLRAMYDRIEPFERAALAEQNRLIDEGYRRGLEDEERLLWSVGGDLPEMGSMADIANFPMNEVQISQVGIGRDVTREQRALESTQAARQSLENAANFILGIFEEETPEVGELELRGRIRSRRNNMGSSAGRINR